MASEALPGVMLDGDRADGLGFAAVVVDDSAGKRD